MKRETRYRLEAALVAGVSVVVRRLPRSVVLATGRRLGRLWARFDPRHLAIAKDNLRHAFPDWDEARIDRTARGVYAHFGAVILDLLWMEGRTAEELLSIADLEGVEHLQKARSDNRGVVSPSAHLGNWEIQAVASVPLVGAVSSIARPLDNPALDRRLVGLRTSTGNTVIYKQKALAQVMRTIRAGASSPSSSTRTCRRAPSSASSVVPPPRPRWRPRSRSRRAARSCRCTASSSRTAAT